MPRETASDGAATPGGSGGAGGSGGGVKQTLLRIWRDERPGVAIARDLVLVAGFLGLVLAGLWGYTGQPFPDTSPLVVIESGSMMHPDPPFGRVGTIDPGDLVLVKVVNGVDDVEPTYGEGEREGYGAKGDVLVYRPRGDLTVTPIIHRALTWVEVTEATDADGNATYSYSYWDDQGLYQDGVDNVTLESARVHGMKPTASGWITKGDNPNTNRFADQISHVPNQLIEPDWLIGKARGEVPWLGLIKLALTGNPTPAHSEQAEQCFILNAWAPCDEWVMLGLSFGAIVLVPVTLDQVAKRHEGFRRWLSR